MSEEVKITVTVKVGNDESMTMNSREDIQGEKRLGVGKGVWLTGIAAAGFLVLRVWDIAILVMDKLS